MIFYRYSLDQEEWEKTLPKLGMVLIPAVLEDGSYDVSVFPNYEDFLYVIESIEEDGIGVRDDVHNNLWHIHNKDLHQWELVMEWHNKSIDPSYVNEQLL